MGTLTPEQKVREYNRGQKAAREGRSRYWSEPSAYPFESNQHYEGRAGAFDQGYDDQFQRNLAEITRNPQPSNNQRGLHKIAKRMVGSSLNFPQSVRLRETVTSFLLKDE